MVEWRRWDIRTTSWVMFCYMGIFIDVVIFNVTQRMWLKPELWYFIWTFLVEKKPFHVYQVNMFYPMTEAFAFDLILQNLNLGNNFWPVSARVLIFHTNISSGKANPNVPTFLTWSLIFFLTVSVRTLIFYIRILRQDLSGKFWPMTLNLETALLFEYFNPIIIHCDKIFRCYVTNDLDIWPIKKNWS